MLAETTLGAGDAHTSAAANPAEEHPASPATATGERDPAELLIALSQRFDDMGAWAGKVQGQITAMHAALSAQAERIEALSLEQARPMVPIVDGAIGYQPTPDQQAELFAAVAGWQYSAAAVDKGQVARIKTRAGDEVSYRYADIGAVSEIARTAGEHGLAHFHREIVIDRQSFIRTYLVHAAGGWISCDVPLLVKENNLISSLQQWASACTMARRYGLFLVLGIAVGDEDDDGAGAGPSPRPRGGATTPAPSPRPAARAPQTDRPASHAP